MLQILEAYIDLNELDNKKILLAAGAELEHHDDLEFMNLSRQGYILTGWMKHVKGTWALEQFMQMGDAGLGQLNLDVVADDHMDMFPVAVSSKAVLGNNYWRHAPMYIAKRMELDDMYGSNTVFLLEKNVREEYAKKDTLQLVIEERQSTIVFI